MKSKILTIIPIITLIITTYTPCPDGSACPEGIRCCDAGKYYSCCRKEFICCYDGLKCCKNQNQFIKNVFGNKIIENSTVAIYKKDNFEKLIENIFDLLKFYQYFPLNQCRKFFNHFLNNFIEKIKGIKNIYDIYHFVDILFNEIVRLNQQIIEITDKYCFNIYSEIKKMIYKIIEFVKFNNFKDKIINNLINKYSKIIQYANNFNNCMKNGSLNEAEKNLRLFLSNLLMIY